MEAERQLGVVHQAMHLAAASSCDTHASAPVFSDSANFVFGKLFRARSRRHRDEGGGLPEGRFQVMESQNSQEELVWQEKVGRQLAFPFPKTKVRVAIFLLCSFLAF